MRSISIEIGGKQREFSFGIRALGNVLQEFDNDIIKYLELLENNGFLAAPPTLYHLHAHALNRSGKEVDFTVNDVEDWLEEKEGMFHNKDVQRVMSEFIKTLTGYVPKQEQQKPSKKK